MPSAKRAGKRTRFGLLCLFGFLILVGFLINPPKSSSLSLQHSATTSVNVRQGGSYLEDGRKLSYSATQGSSGAIANIGGESGSLTGSSSSSIGGGGGDDAVSYTHLTLPTN